MKKIIWVILLVFIMGGMTACTRPLADASVASFDAVSRTFNCDPNKAYYAVRWALQLEGYPVANEDLANGIIKSDWVATTSDSHFIAPFGHRDYGVSNSYHQIVVNIVPTGGAVRIEVASAVKSLFALVKTSYIQENKVLTRIADYLRNPDTTVTNLGLEE